MALKVELRYATLPSFLGWFAVHYWFVVFDEQGCHRWEVWQTKNAGGRSVGHVHCDLKPPDAGVGGGPARLAAQWTGREATAIKIFSKRQRRTPSPRNTATGRGRTATPSPPGCSERQGSSTSSAPWRSGSAILWRETCVKERR